MNSPWLTRSGYQGKMTIHEEYIVFLKQFCVDYDEKYIFYEI